jgi:hypothetical protein
MNSFVKITAAGILAALAFASTASANSSATANRLMSENTFTKKVKHAPKKIVAAPADASKKAVTLKGHSTHQTKK